VCRDCVGIRMGAASESAGTFLQTQVEHREYSRTEEKLTRVFFVPDTFICSHSEMYRPLRDHPHCPLPAHARPPAPL